MENVTDWVRKQIPEYNRMFHTTDRHSGRKSYYLDGRTFTYRISFARVYGGADVRISRTLRENSGGNFSHAGNEPSPEPPPPDHGGQANASYYTPPRRQERLHRASSSDMRPRNPSGTDEVADSSRDLSGAGIAMIAVGVLIASSLLIAAFFLAPQIFVGVFVLGLIATISGVFLDKDTVRNIGIVVLAIGIVGMLVAAAFPTG